MHYLGEFLSYILMAVFAQNVLLGRAVGLSEMTTADAEYRPFVLGMAAVTGAFSSAGILLMWLLSRFVSGQSTYLAFALLHSLLCVVLYFASDRLLLRFSPEKHDVWGGMLPYAMLNSIVIAAPVSALAGHIPHWYGALGYGIGAGLGLFLAVFLIRNGMDLLDHPAIPHAFRGMPILLLYLGILSLGFCAFL